MPELFGSTVKRLRTLGRDVDRLAKPEQNTSSALANVIGHILGLPGLRAFWPMSSFRTTGEAVDIGNVGFNLAYNGNPTYNYTGLVPYLALDGVGDYLSYPDHANFDILGTEAYVAAAARGLTLGGFFYNNNVPAAVETFMSKADGTVNSSYLLYRVNTGVYRFLVGTGAATVAATTTGVPSTAAWHCVIGRFDPGTVVELFVDGTWYTNAVAVPAALLNSVFNLCVGAFSAGTFPLAGRVSMPFICATDVDDEWVERLWRMGRELLEV